MAYYSQVSADGYFTHRLFTTDPNFQPQDNCRILLDNPPEANSTHHPELVYPVRAEATEVEYVMVESTSQAVEAITASERIERNKRLVEHVDSIGPIEWESFTDAEKAEIKQYRIDLLNVPQQDGFPHAIQWPEKPECIGFNIRDKKKMMIGVAESYYDDGKFILANRIINKSN